MMKEKLQELFADVLGQTLGEEELTRDNAAWDSLAHLNVVLAIEEEFGVDIPPEDFQALHSDLSTIIKYLETRV